MDNREINHRWYTSFDEKTMTLTVEGDEGEVEIPAKYEVCSTCEGKGSHVNPSIDSKGLTAEDFNEDPEFLEEYRRGTYDVACVECKGARVVPAVDDERATKEEIALAERVAKSHFDGEVERWYERERGY